MLSSIIFDAIIDIDFGIVLGASMATDAAFRTPIYSFSALKSNQREVKRRGREDVVHITENGNAAYIFCSEEVFEREKARAAEEAISEMQIAQLIERGRKDVASGNVIEGLEEGRARMLSAWGRHG